MIERYPVDPKSGYTRQIVWIDQEEYRSWKIEYFDRKDALLKTLTYHDYQQYLGRYWRPDRMAMVTCKGRVINTDGPLISFQIEAHDETEPRTMSVPRPAMFVAMVIVPGRPASTMICASRACCLAFST